MRAAAHLPTIVGRVHKLVGVSPRYDFDEPARPDEIEMLIATLLDIEPAHIANAQTRAMHKSVLTMYAGARTVAAPVRLNLLKWMAKSKKAKGTSERAHSLSYLCLFTLGIMHLTL